MSKISKTALTYLSERELLTLRTKIVSEITDNPNGAISSVTTRDLSVSYAINGQYNAYDVLEAITYALSKNWPETYGRLASSRKMKYVV